MVEGKGTSRRSLTKYETLTEAASAAGTGLRQVVLDFFLMLIGVLGFTAVKNTECQHLLTFFPPGINPDWMMECKSWDFPA